MRLVVDQGEDNREGRDEQTRSVTGKISTEKWRSVNGIEICSAFLFRIHFYRIHLFLSLWIVDVFAD